MVVPNSSTMKKTILLMVLAPISLLAQIQSRITTRTQPTETPALPAGFLKKIHIAPETTTSLNIVQIGSSVNAFGAAYGNSQGLAVNPATGSVAYIHRADITQPNGSMQIDASKDGGNNWVVNRNVWAGTGGRKAHYPRACGIYNPPSNLNPNNTQCVFTGSVLAGANDIWGGIALGNVKIDFTQIDTTLLTATTAQKFAITDGIAITPNAAYILQDETDYANSATYLGNYSIFKGVWNAQANNFTWSTNIPTTSTQPGYIKIPVAQQTPAADKKIAFSQKNPNIGYIAAITNTSSNTQYYQLVVLKTTDAGLSWNSNAPQVIDVSNIGNAVFGTVNQAYSPGFELDAAVDSANNLDIAIAVARPSATTTYTLNTPQGSWGIFHINTDGNAVQQWRLLAKPNAFRGIYGNLRNDSRIQISKTASGSHTFFSWLDTDTTLLGNQSNSAPNIFMRAMRHYDHRYNQAQGGDTLIRLTQGTDADALCHFAVVGDYVFEANDALGNAVFKIPAVFQSWNGNEADAVTWYYINNALINKNNLFSGNVAVYEPKNQQISIAPNPTDGILALSFGAVQPVGTKIDIRNMLNQTVALYQVSNQTTERIDVSQLKKGIYIIHLNGYSSKFVKN